MNAFPPPVSAADYHADPCEQPSLSASVARVLCSRTPLHAWNAHPRLNPNYQRIVDEKFDVGIAAHSLLLEGEDRICVVDADDWRTNAAKEARDVARLHEKIPMLPAQYEQTVQMVDSVRAQLEAIDVLPTPFTDGQAEATLMWEDGGAWCRARLDWLHNDSRCVDDFKTTSGVADPEKWSRRLYDLGYDVQEAFYRRAVRQVRGVEAAFRWIVAETQPPYAVSVISLAPAAQALADAKVEYALATWRRCVDSDTWPGYPDRVCFAEAPPWEEARWLEKEAREAA